MRTLTGPGGPGLHRVYWDLRTRQRTLGPAGLRDSINTARARRQREDSVRAARGADTAGGGRAGGQRGGSTGEINLRPAEGPIGGAAPEGGGAGGGGGFFGGARLGNLVEPGDFLVTINAGGQTMRQVVRVERVGEIVNVDFPPDEDEEPEAAIDP